MAAPAVSNVVAGKPLASGGVLNGPLGTALPTNASTPPDAAFKALGYISEDGLTETTERSTEKVRAWGGDTVKVIQTEFAATFSFSFIESVNADVLKVVYGDSNVTTTAATPTAGTLHAIKVTGEELDHDSWIFEVKDGDARIRIVVPNGQVTTVGEITYSDGGVIQYDVTVETFKDASGAYYYKYIDNGVVDPA